MVFEQHSFCQSVSLKGTYLDDKLGSQTRVLGSHSRKLLESINANPFVHLVGIRRTYGSLKMY